MAQENAEEVMLKGNEQSEKSRQMKEQGTRTSYTSTTTQGTSS